MANQYVEKKADGVSAISDNAAGRAIIRNIGNKAAGFVYDRVANFLKYNGNDAVKTVVDAESTQTISGVKTLTTPVLGAATATSLATTAGVTGPDASEVVIATNIITAAESGKTFFLNAATEFASTLPAPSQGLHYRFIVTAAPSGADYTVVTESAAQILAGRVHSAAGDAGDVESTATGTTITFVAAQSVVGDYADVYSDGTSWFAICSSAVAAGITITG